MSTKLKLHREVYELYYLDYLVNEIFKAMDEADALSTPHYKEFKALCDLGEMSRTGKF